MFVFSSLLFCLHHVLSNPGNIIKLVKDEISGSLLLPVLISEEVNTRRILNETNLIKNSGSCAFYTFGFYVKGVCTPYGSCRVAKSDYMYSGGCGELAVWGEKSIEGQQVERMVTPDAL